LHFHDGLNVILAQKSPGASDRQTRNGAGKTSFIELVHFLLGGNCGPEHFLQVELLATHAFAIDFDLRDSPIQVERTARAKSKVAVTGGDVRAWPRAPKLDKKTGHLVLRNSDWRAVLGAMMFGIPADNEEDEDRRFGPTFRSLFPYFARRQNAGGLVSPEKQSEDQQPYDQQVALSYLLGLDASIPQQLQEVRQREKALKEVRKAAKEGAFGEFVPRAADLRTKLTVHEARLSRLRGELDSFHVVPEYRHLEEEAADLTKRLDEDANENQTDRELARRLEESMRTETPPQFADVRHMYEEAGIILSALVRKRFEEVQIFHRSVVENRRSHLRAELEAARRRLHEREIEQERLDRRRAEIMSILRSGGALEQFAKLQGELGRLEAQTESLRRRFEAAETLERNGAQLQVERARLYQRLKDDHHEQKEAIDVATLAFEDLSNALYEKAGSLTVSDTANGPSFEITIEGSRSKGISNMQIFCFDMMLMELCARRGMGPGFLIHDSHLFDGVDGRQVAHAIELGAARARKLGFQYIVTMNEDAVPRTEFTPGFRFDEHVVGVRLTDAVDDGGLFGIRFQ
jgi:uncharacterized protein YydD (DUF2326 family)